MNKAKFGWTPSPRSFMTLAEGNELAVLLNKENLKLGGTPVIRGQNGANRGAGDAICAFESACGEYVT